MQFALPPISPLVRDLFSAWHYTRVFGPVPDYHDLMIEARRQGLGDTPTLLFEVCTPPALRVRASSPALDAHLGIALEGLDMLEVTSEAERPRRYGRFHAVVHQPCGLHSQERIAHGLNPSEVSEALFLPVRFNDDSGLHVLGVLPSFRNWQRHPTTVPLISAWEWVDLGAGVPGAEHDPPP